MVTIRDGRPTDHTKLRTIQENALSASSPGLLESGTRGPLGLVVADDNGPVGYVLVLESKETALLLELAVASARQGDGIGSALLEAALARVEAETVRLTAHAADSRVHRFYERHGFERRDVLDGYFESGDGIVFTKQL
ncbi:ribosomal-protein-alanine N-acetyltransferase [Halovenus aranensis]|uniref:Ribosomal-protein-alanine N-acetyltransferase n=1 Tax=Halovenus aranensis TaxID=890420 RepID=A0A1G8TM79_9EURY|nr:GNAT family N-acetyltransferase [Halovenus aranensis]SDJ42523.1 ribosomal-protein-alanine N-acetyltransferase [Halovenus aranensis]